MNKRIQKILEYVKGPMVLDVGCLGSNPDEHSPYWLHQHLRDRFPDVVGIDIDPDMIKKLSNKGYSIFVGNAESFELNKKFDTIVAGELIEHLSNPGQFLQTAKHHLKHGGKIIITTPYPFALINILYALLKYPKTCSNIEHTAWFCPATLMELTKRYNLKVCHFELIEDYYFGVSSILYRLVVYFLKIFKVFVPKRLRCNAMLFVLEENV